MIGVINLTEISCPFKRRIGSIDGSIRKSLDNKSLLVSYDSMAGVIKLMEMSCPFQRKIGAIECSIKRILDNKSLLGVAVSYDNLSDIWCFVRCSFYLYQFANRCIILLQVNECVRGTTTILPALSRLNLIAKTIIFLAFFTGNTKIDTAIQHRTANWLLGMLSWHHPLHFNWLKAIHILEVPVIFFLKSRSTSSLTFLYENRC